MYLDLDSSYTGICTYQSSSSCTPKIMRPTQDTLRDGERGRKKLRSKGCHASPGNWGLQWTKYLVMTNAGENGSAAQREM